jgi:hypothetical protein
MTYQAYRKGILLTLFVLGLLFFTQQIGRVLFVHRGVPFIFTINYLALRITVIFFLFFSIYALLSKIKEIRKLESPIIFIVISALFVILSYGPPIAAFYLTSHDMQNPYVLSALSADEVKKEALNSKNTSGKRYTLVENYYFETGERLPWLDENNKKSLYTPDEKALARKKLRQSLMESYRMLELSRINLRITAFTLIGLLIISTICFIGFLRYRFPRSQ